MKRACFNGGDGETQKSSGFRDAQTFQFAVQNDDSQLLSKSSNCLEQGCAAFAFAKDFFWCGSAAGDLHSAVTLSSIHIMFVKRLSSAALSQQH